MKLYKARELAEIMQVHEQTIYRLAARGEIESYRVGKTVRFPMPELQGTNRGHKNDTGRQDC